MSDIAAIVLAAGAGTRMKSDKPKVVHEVLGKPMVDWVIDAAAEAGAARIVTVVGHGREHVIPLVEGKSEIAIQEEQLGTADAVKCAMASPSLTDYDGPVVILSGDCPLISSDTIAELAYLQKVENAGAVVLTMLLEDPFGYGRILKDPEGKAIVRIVEQKDGTAEELEVCECNSGFYCFDAEALRNALSKIGSENAQGEFYLTDALEIIRSEGLPTVALIADDPEECLGVNSRKQLAEAIRVKQRQINDRLMDGGVTMICPDMVWAGPEVTIESDCVIHPNVTLIGNVHIAKGSTILPTTMLKDTTVGEGCTVGPNTRIYGTVIGSDCTIDETYAKDARIDSSVSTGPRAYIRPGTHMCEGSKAGTHVEIKNSTIGKGSKVPHLSYIGDATIGEDVNIGAGSITCNYDGVNKHKTFIGDRTFIGSDTMMVAPVKIGDDVVIGAGSVITTDIPDKALAVARSREHIKENWNRNRSS